MMDNITISYWEQNQEECLQMFSQEQSLNKIPLLNDIANYKEFGNKLVRFKGMIQDILNPVYYFEKCQVLNTNNQMTSIRSGKYRDFIEFEEHEEVLYNSLENIHQEKHLLHCIKVPGLNSWTRQFKYVDEQCSVFTRNEKRKLEVDEGSKTDDSMDVDLSDSKKKCSRYAGDNSSEECSSNTNFSLANDAESNLPTSNNDNSFESCLLNIYDYESEDLLVNNVVEVVGFLSVKSNFNKMNGNDDDADKTPEDYFSLLPRIHVVHIIPNASVFNNLLQYHKEYVLQNALQFRENLWLLLTDILMGDTLAADYLICHLISTIYFRKDVTVLGKFSLNLSNVPFQLCNFGYVTHLYRFLAHFLEKSCFLPITISYLNSTNMIPKKNYDENRLISGVLQISDRTHLIIDETKLEPGQLIDNGVRNVNALSDVITSQKLDYDFGFYKLPFNTDISVLSLSQAKSLLPSDCHVNLEVDISCVQNIDEAFSRVWQKMRDPLLSNLRVYLNVVSHIDYNVPSSMEEIIQKDFVNLRKEENSCTTADDLHRLLVLSRLLSISRGCNTLAKDTWNYACLMEKQRKLRLL